MEGFMNSYNSYIRPYLFKGLIALFFTASFSSHSIASYLPLEIYQPQPNLNTENRFYKAYPDLEYNVRMAVAGGEFPYQFSLTNAPEGLTIDERGEINWPNPIESGTPYQVSVNVTDAEFTTRSVSWTITVTTSGFWFVDAVNGTTKGAGGDGSIGNPWKTMLDVWGNGLTKNQTHNRGDFVYWREGTYTLTAPFEDSGVQQRIAWKGSRRPLVWLAYPGDNKPEIDFNSVDGNGWIEFYESVQNLYIEGFYFNNNGNSRGKTIALSSASGRGNVVFRKNRFRNQTVCNGHGGNQSMLFFTGGEGEYNAIQDNEADNGCGYFLLGYSAHKTVVENNTITNIPLPISPKNGNVNWTIRGNVIRGQTTSGAIYFQSYGYSGKIEISYNLIQMKDNNGLALKYLGSNPGGPIYAHRNTIIGHVKIWYLKTSKGPWYFTNNVIINNSSSPDKLTRDNVQDESRLIQSDNLVGEMSDNIVDSQGYLTANYSNFIGTRGFEIGIRPKPPTGISAQ